MAPTDEITTDMERKGADVFVENHGAETKNLNAAYEAENEEHQMTVIQALKAYPMACFWAFIMAFCIVSCTVVDLS